MIIFFFHFVFCFWKVTVSRFTRQFSRQPTARSSLPLRYEIMETTKELQGIQQQQQQHQQQQQQKVKIINQEMEESEKIRLRASLGL